jgi:hypothetical protein
VALHRQLSLDAPTFGVKSVTIEIEARAEPAPHPTEYDDPALRIAPSLRQGLMQRLYHRRSQTTPSRGRDSSTSDSDPERGPTAFTTPHISVFAPEHPFSQSF